nr:hypothetical protein [Sunxiuqinia sp.]
MKLLFITKGSAKIGFGHIVRSSTLAQEAVDAGHGVTYIAIGAEEIKNILKGKNFSPMFLEKESDLLSQAFSFYDAVIFDLLELKTRSFLFLSSRTARKISISPIFNHNSKVDLLFNRTKYVDPEIQSLDLRKYCGLDYTILKRSCLRVDTGEYIKNLDKENLHIAISMGGGDAQNKTLQFLRQVKGIIVPTTFWVLLGEGYKHSYNQLIEEISLDLRHEIILAKTNRSMWRIVNNCSMIVLAGGITTYEAAFCGIPSINFLYKKGNSYLIEELVENQACINAGEIDESNIMRKFPGIVNHLFRNKEQLIKMHQKSMSLVDDRGCERILNVLQNSL